jgi:toxin ParE1/3/4
VKVSFLAAALGEQLAQVEFYNALKAGLGTDYLAEVSAAIDRISDSPTRFPAMRAPSYRRCVMQRFPFTIIFRQSAGAIVIVAIAAQRRAPNYWLRR